MRANLNKIKNYNSGKLLEIMEIKIGKKGLIKAGKYKGWYILVGDDSKRTGGYLILYSQSPNIIHGIGYDDWVENLEYLELYFSESNMIIEWLE